jgi:hypothetical protein
MIGMINRKLLCILLIGFSIALVSGCRKKTAISIPAPAPPAPAVVITPPPPPPPPAITPVAPPSEPVIAMALPKIIPMPILLELADRNFRAGDYKRAAQNYEKFLIVLPNSKDCDQALFHLGLSHILASEPDRDLRQGEAAFRRLIAQFPQSPYRSQAEFILGLQGQIAKLRSDVKERDEKIKRLSDELQKLKQIDMQRRPSKPKE